jgi:hypothetical protein
VTKPFHAVGRGGGEGKAEQGSGEDEAFGHG